MIIELFILSKIKCPKCELLAFEYNGLMTCNMCGWYIISKQIKRSKSKTVYIKSFADNLLKNNPYL